MNFNEDAITEFLTMQYVLGDHTFREGEKSKRPVDVPKYKLHDNAKTSDVEDALKKSINK